MKKIIILMLAGILTLSVYGCSKTDDKKPEDSNVQTEENKDSVTEENNNSSENNNDENSDKDSSGIKLKDSSEEAQVNEPAVNFTLKDENGEDVTLEDLLKDGKPVMLNFWYKDCIYCVEEMPELTEVYKERDDIKIVLVNVGNDVDNEIKYVKDENIEIPCLYGGSAVASKYFITGTPTNIFIASDGTLLHGQPGKLDKAGFNTLIDSVLNLK